MKCGRDPGPAGMRAPKGTNSRQGTTNTLASRWRGRRLRRTDRQHETSGVSHLPSRRTHGSLHCLFTSANATRGEDSPWARLPDPPLVHHSLTERGMEEGEGKPDAEADMLSAEASSAICVQRFDDSRNSAIHITYRISLRSSSLREPRYPLLRVIFGCRVQIVL